MEPSSLDARRNTASDEKDDDDEKNTEKKPQANLKNDAADEKNESAPAAAETAAATVAAETAPISAAPRFPSQRQQRRRRRRKEPPPGPVRPLSAYNYFFRDERERWLAERETQGSHTEKARELFSIMGKAIAQRWKSLNAEAVAKYDRIAEQDRERYQRERKLYLEEKAQSGNVEAEEHVDHLPNETSADVTDPPANKKRATTAATAKDSVKNRPRPRKRTDPSTKNSKRSPSLTKDSSTAKLSTLEDSAFRWADGAPAGSSRGQSRAQLTAAAAAAAAEGAASIPALPQSDFHLSQLLSESLVRHQTAYPTSFAAVATEAASTGSTFTDPMAWIPCAKEPVNESTTTRIAHHTKQDPQPPMHRPLALPQQQFHPYWPQASTVTTSSSATLDQHDRMSHEPAVSQSDLIRALLTRMEQQRQLPQLEQQQQQLSQLEQQQQQQLSQLEQLSQRSMPPLQQLLPQATHRLDVSARDNPHSLPLEESYLLRAMLHQNQRSYTSLAVPPPSTVSIPAFHGFETVWPRLPASIDGSQQQQQQQQHRRDDDQDYRLEPSRAESTRGNVGRNVNLFPSLNEIIATRLQAQQHGEPMQEVPYQRPHPLLANPSISLLLRRQLEETQTINSRAVAAMESSYVEQRRQQMIQEQQTWRQRDSQQQQQQQQRVEENILQIVARLQQEREEQHIKDQSSLQDRGR